MTGSVPVRASYGSAIMCMAGCICAITWCASLPLAAQQPRTTRDGVYTSAQAKRGEALYQKRCASCHGMALGGDVGPPLAGQDFLGVWNGQPLSNLFDKIHNTMPLDAPGTLTGPQAADVVAYILQANAFDAGRAELGASDAALKQISLPTATATAAATPAASRGAAALAFPPVGNLNQVMRGILFPSSNILFDVQTQDPGTQKPVAAGDASTVTTRYGNVYAPWVLVDIAAISLAESAPLLMTPGRRCENGKAVPVDRADWQQYVQGLVDAGRAAYKAAQTRNQDAVIEVTTVVADACANCHRAYRDRRPAAMRCAAQ
jgi:mono/diheme cytochrome c family protein